MKAIFFHTSILRTVIFLNVIRKRIFVEVKFSKLELLSTTGDISPMIIAKQNSQELPILYNHDCEFDLKICYKAFIVERVAYTHLTAVGNFYIALLEKCRFK